MAEERNQPYCRQEPRIDRLETIILGVQGNNGLYGEVRDLKKQVEAGFDKLEEKNTNMYKLLAMTALSILATGVGVILTLLLTRAGP